MTACKFSKPILKDLFPLHSCTVSSVLLEIIIKTKATKYKVKGKGGTNMVKRNRFIDDRVSVARILNRRMVLKRDVLTFSH
ncbi:hypothetical protein DKX38_015330 [Salix brachista]|uniref:Uncharacterized protein n=1 Tax=Salix brachista TaxID=2182728 RepID=A0A5N5L4W8_9ROSI|nr:hypothetical protein DKX38_015330 [Salix brachista]